LSALGVRAQHAAVAVQRVAWFMAVRGKISTRTSRSRERIDPGGAATLTERSGSRHERGGAARGDGTRRDSWRDDVQAADIQPALARQLPAEGHAAECVSLALPETIA